MIINPNPENPIKISIAMATFNGEKYLKEQLQSFTSQTRLPDELVVCDDFSSDRTIDILHDFSATAPFSVKVICNKRNLGYVKNFEKALSICAGNLIFLSDQDDFWLPKKIEIQSRYMEEVNTSCWVSVCDLEICDENLTRSKRTKIGNILDGGVSIDEHIVGCAMVLRRQCLELLLPIPEHEQGHDNWIARIVGCFGEKAIISEPLQLYRRHGENSSDWIYSRQRRISQLDVIREYGLKSPLSGWQKNMDSLKRARQRIEAQRPRLEKDGLKERTNSAIEKLDESLELIEGRMFVIQKPRIVRWLFVTQLMLKGGYRSFSGWKSAVKDIIRP
jgi:glycosyltransferase involved in cell wall biosynthesis